MLKLYYLQKIKQRNHVTYKIIVFFGEGWGGDHSKVIGQIKFWGAKTKVGNIKNH